MNELMRSAVPWLQAFNLVGSFATLFFIVVAEIWRRNLRRLDHRRHEALRTAVLCLVAAAEQQDGGHPEEARLMVEQAFNSVCDAYDGGTHSDYHAGG